VSTKPENTFIRSIHKKIPRVYAEKMNNPWRAGTADVWYSGSRGDLWVEYKYIERIPRSKNILPDLTPRQKLWLNSRVDEGRNVAVVLGTPTGGVIYRNKEWMSPLTDTELARRIVSKDDISRWILDQVGDGACNQSLE
jgi:hypothetical protein